MDQDLDFRGPSHSLLISVQASAADPKVWLGTKGRCRYCGETAPARFRKLAHAFPEALGNKWVFSRDECDGCNEVFARCEDALATMVGPVLTLGGTMGKGNKVRQTGASSAPIRIRAGRQDGRRRLSFASAMDAPGNAIELGADGSASITIPAPVDRYVPAYAYRALVKMGLALLPEPLLPHFTKLRQFVTDLNASGFEGPHLVTVSFGVVGNAAPLVMASLAQRTQDSAPPPFMVFNAAIGSLNFQMHLKSDAEWDDGRCASVHFDTKVFLGPKDHPDQIVIRYETPTLLDLRSNERSLTPIRRLRTSVSGRNTSGRIVPLFT